MALLAYFRSEGT